MQIGIVRSLSGEHSEQDFEKPLAQAPQRADVGHALLAFLFIVGLAPSAGLAEAIRPQMDGVAQEFVAGPAHANFVEACPLVRDRCGPGDTLEHFMAAVALGIASY